MVDLPPGWPMYCCDLKQWADDLGNPPLPEQTDEHNALSDARWDKQAWEFLGAYQMAHAQGFVEIPYARARVHEKESARTVDQEPGNLRSSKKRGQRQVNGSGDLERATQENR